MSRVGRAIVAGVVTALSACAADGGGLQPWDDPGTSEEFLGYDNRPELELLVEQEDVARLETSPREYVPATLVYQGQSFGPVGVRVKGQNSFLPFSQKPSLRINVTEYVDDVTFYGLKDLTLNNMASDPSQMHERLAYSVARAAGLPASRANHAIVTVNGEFYGLYANVETVKPRMLSAHFDDQNGSLYEATDVDFTRALIAGYELDAGPDDRSLLLGLADALAIEDPTASLAAAATYVDLDHFQRYWAMTSVIGQFDGFPFSMPGDDYFLYADPSTRKLWFIPWGMDETFFAADFSPMQVQSVLARRCAAVPACLQGFADRVWELQAQTEAMGLADERARVQAEIADAVGRDTRRPFTAAEVEEGQTQLGYFITGRRQVLGGFVPPPSDAPAP